MDYEVLLAKYIRFIRACEGIDFIDSRRNEVRTAVEFTDEEWTELERISKEQSEAE